MVWNVRSDRSSFHGPESGRDLRFYSNILFSRSISSYLSTANCCLMWCGTSSNANGSSSRCVNVLFAYKTFCLQRGKLCCCCFLYWNKRKCSFTRNCIGIDLVYHWVIAFDRDLHYSNDNRLIYRNKDNYWLRFVANL